MRDYVIVTDSSCDLPADIVNKYGVKVVPMGMVFDGNTYKHHYDWNELHKEEYYDKLRNGAIGSTSGTNYQDAMDMMESVLAEGKDVLYLSLSSGLSCSYQNANLAAQELREKYENARVEVVDTRSVCLGVGILVYMAAKAKEEGKSYDDVLALVQNNCMRVRHYFAVDDLSALQRSGRISHLTSVVGSIIGIKPMFTIGENGKVSNHGKVRGRKAALRQILADGKANATSHDIFAICHADTEEDAEAAKKQLNEDYPNADIIVGNIGPIIGINTGVNTMAIICLGEERV